MKLSTDHSGNIRRFTVKLGWKEQFDRKEIELLSSGSIPMLIPVVSVQGKKNNIVQYDISQYSTLEFYLSCILSREQFAELLLQCMGMMKQVQKAYLNHNNLLLNPDQVYILLSDRSVHFIYLPLAESKRSISILEFFRGLVRKASRSTYEQSGFLDACSVWLNRSSSFVLDEFEHFVKEQAFGGDAGHKAFAESVYVEKVDKKAAQMAEEPQKNRESLGENVQRAVREDRIYRPVPKEQQKISQGGTTLLTEAFGGTVLLGEEEPVKPEAKFYLKRVEPEELVELTHFPFLVGKERGSADYCITGNAAVSRRHAEFSVEDGHCMIADQKSTNKTYVNDCALEPLTACKLNDGDRIRLGNESFVFIREE